MLPLAAARRDMALAAAFADLHANRAGRAAERCAGVLCRDPGDADALLLSGLAAAALGMADVAAERLVAAAAAKPRRPGPWRDLGVFLRRTGKRDLIEPVLRAALRVAPGDAAGCCELADHLYESGTPEAAIPPLQDLLRRQPDHKRAANLLALALAASGRTQAAIRLLRHAIARDPAEPAGWANLGLLLKDEGQFDAALAAYDTAIGLAPADPQLRVNRVVALLRAGRWPEAWPDYEWRLKLAGGEAPARLLPAVSGLGSLAGRTVLAVHEDGFGDTLQFARYLALLHERGARVVVRVPRVLVRIMQTVPGVAAILEPGDPPPDHDYVCPFFSLPRAFETRPDGIPAPIPYMHADAALTAAWRRRLPVRGPRAGLVWAGQARPSLPGFATLDARRSMPLSAMAPLAIPGMTFVSLQHGPEAAQAQCPPAGMTLHDPMAEVGDFADTAAIIANLDLVISVDTAVVHLAGALGTPVFLLDRFDHCWRWLSGRSDSPWYPGMRIFRQRRIGDWTPVLRDAAAALQQFADQDR